MSPVLAQSVGSLRRNHTSGVGGEADMPDIAQTTRLTGADLGSLWVAYNCAAKVGKLSRLERLSAIRHGSRRYSRSRTGSKSSECPSTRSDLPKTAWEAPMDTTVMLREFCDAVERRDGKRFADLF